MPRSRPPLPEHVIGARWVVRSTSPEAAERVISEMLEGLLGEQAGDYGYLGTYQSVDSPIDARKQAENRKSSS